MPRICEILFRASPSIDFRTLENHPFSPLDEAVSDTEKTCAVPLSEVHAKKE